MWQVEIRMGRGWKPVKFTQRESHSDAQSELKRVKSGRLARCQMRVAYVPVAWTQEGN